MTITNIRCNPIGNKYQLNWPSSSSNNTNFSASCWPNSQTPKIMANDQTIENIGGIISTRFAFTSDFEWERWTKNIYRIKQTVRGKKKSDLTNCETNANMDVDIESSAYANMVKTKNSKTSFKLQMNLNRKKKIFSML